MLIPFRQGIVKYPKDTTGNQTFLFKSDSKISLRTDQGRVLVAFAHQNTNYLHTEHHSTEHAWSGPFTAGTDYWLYWELDLRTAVRTFGHTTLQPIVSSNKPTSAQIGQMWFDAVNKQMYEYNGTGWFEVLRVIACKYDKASTIRAWNGSYDFSGSQVNQTGYREVGSIIYDEFDSPLRRSNRTFFTTVDKLTTGIDVVSSIRLDSMTFQAAAKQTMAAYTVVQLTDFGIIEPAGTSNLRYGVFGVILDDVVPGQIVDVTTSGVLRNVEWNWPYVNTLVYYSETGEITTTARPGIDPIGYVVEPTKIILQQYASGSGGSGANQIAQGHVGQGEISINTSISWHIIEQTGPVVLQFAKPVGNSVVSFTLEVIGNGQDPILWPDDNGIFTVPANQTRLYQLTYRPEIDGYPARWMRTSVDYL